MTSIPPVPLSPIVDPKTGIMNQTFSQWLVQSIRPAVANSLSTITLTGDVTGSGGSSFATTISAGAVTLGKMAPLAPASLIGNAFGSPVTPQALAPAQVVSMLPAGGDLSGTYAAPTVVGIKGSALPPLTTGNLRYSGGGWAFDPTAYAADSLVVHLAGAETITGTKTFSVAPTSTAYQVGGVQVLGAQVTGIGATISTYTLSGTYATDLAKLQLLYNQVLALVAALKTHGMVAT